MSCWPRRRHRARLMNRRCAASQRLRERITRPRLRRFAPRKRPPPDATRRRLSAPARIVEFDTGKLKGDLYRLSWSPDAQQLYLQTVERDRTGNIKTAHHYLLTLDGKSPKSVDEEPRWSAD